MEVYIAGKKLVIWKKKKSSLLQWSFDLLEQVEVCENRGFGLMNMVIAKLQSFGNWKIAVFIRHICRDEVIDMKNLKGIERNRAVMQIMPFYNKKLIILHCCIVPAEGSVFEITESSCKFVGTKFVSLALVRTKYFPKTWTVLIVAMTVEAYFSGTVADRVHFCKDSTIYYREIQTLLYSDILPAAGISI